MSEYSWLLEERTDNDLKDMLQKYLLETEEYESKIKNNKILIGDIDRELEMRRLAGSHEDLKAFRAHLKDRRKVHIGTVTGRMSSAEPNISNAPKSLPKHFFRNEAHELPPIKKSELRKQNKRLRDAKKAGKRWCSICLSGPAGLWEHAEKGSDFCRRHG